MIDEYSTYLMYGYTSDDLKPKSSKRVLRLCDECGKGKIVIYNQYRDLCASCSRKGHRNYFYGKHHTDEIKMKISKSRKGFKHTEESKKKMSESSKNKKITEEHKQKISKAVMGENNGMYNIQKEKHPSYGKPGSMLGKTHTKESKKKMRKSLQRHHIAYDFYNKNALVIMVTSSFHSKIHKPKGVQIGTYGYSLID